MKTRERRIDDETALRHDLTSLRVPRASGNEVQMKRFRGWKRESRCNNSHRKWFCVPQSYAFTAETIRIRIFFLTFVPKNLIYESHCDLVEVANFDVRENQSMKNATKKAAAKKTAKKPAKKGKK